jgi:cytochrome c oxidase subunit 2
MQSWLIIYTQDSNRFFIEHIIFTIDHRITISIRVRLITRIIILITTYNNQFERYLSENSEIEVFWTIVPAAILWFIGAPSIKTLFLSEDIIFPLLTFKATGHQWYWSYEYTDLKEIQFDSFIERNRKIRLLLANNHLILPSKTTIRSIVTSEDVIHSWAIPSIGIKADAIPGRLNQAFLFMNRNGIFTGQCSELCGAGHSFIPIIISSIPSKEFSERIKSI